jgi:serine/threonine protein kinase
MGTVWLADHLTLDLRCAVKFMTREATDDPTYRARFELEAKAIAQLHSPNVVRVIDYDAHDGLPFIAMEYLQGEDLAARLRRLGKLDAQTTYRIISQVARGLAKAHAAGIVHRDLKPENIFLAEEDEVEVAKLLDFGIAKLTAFAICDGFADRTQAGSLLGTPAYMSPEQARGLSDIDHRSDLWSLAVITYECLVGKLPFESPALGDLFAQIMFEPVPTPSHVAPSLPADFDWWWARAALRSVDGRFATAVELADALGPALRLVDRGPVIRDSARAMEEGLVRSVPPPPRTRRPKLVAACLGAAVVLVVVLLLNVRVGAPVANAGVAVPSAPSVVAALPAPAPAPLPAPAPFDDSALRAALAAAAAHADEPAAAPAHDASANTRDALTNNVNARRALNAPPPVAHSANRRPGPLKPSADDVDFGI